MVLKQRAEALEIDLVHGGHRNHHMGVCPCPQPPPQSVPRPTSSSPWGRPASPAARVVGTWSGSRNGAPMSTAHGAIGQQFRHDPPRQGVDLPDAAPAHRRRTSARKRARQRMPLPHISGPLPSALKRRMRSSPPAWGAGRGSRHRRPRRNGDRTSCTHAVSWCSCRMPARGGRRRRGHRACRKSSPRPWYLLKWNTRLLSSGALRQPDPMNRLLGMGPRPRGPARSATQPGFGPSQPGIRCRAALDPRAAAAQHRRCAGGAPCAGKTCAIWPPVGRMATNPWPCSTARPWSWIRCCA
jgi:hypothetical protein